MRPKLATAQLLCAVLGGQAYAPVMDVISAEDLAPEWGLDVNGSWVNKNADCAMFTGISATFSDPPTNDGLRWRLLFEGGAQIDFAAEDICVEHSGQEVGIKLRVIPGVVTHLAA